LAGVDGGAYNSDIAELVLEKMCFKSILTSLKKIDREKLLFDDKTNNSPDAFYSYKNQSILWEFKGYMLPDSLLEKPSFETFKSYLDDRFVQNSNGKRKGVSQLAYVIDLMAKGKTAWYQAPEGSNGRKKQQIFPVLSFDDFYFTMPGVNKYLNKIFQDKLTDDAKTVFDIMPVTLINLDLLFYLSVRKSDFGELKQFIIRYWNIINARARKYQKTGLSGDFLASLASFNEIFHIIMTEDLRGRLPTDPMTVLLELGNISQERLDAEI
jgi:hypothetical protein